MRRSTIIALAAIVAALLVAAPSAGAARVKLAAGSTTLQLDSRTAKALTGAGVSVAPVQPAQAKRGGISFPITGGSINPASAAGRIEHSGGLVFRAGGKSVTIKDFRVHVGGKSGILTARAGKARLTVLSLSLSKAKLKRQGLGTTVTGIRAALSGQAARALNAAFGVKLFSRGLPIGKVAVQAQPADVAIAGGSTTLALDSGAAAALGSLGITPGVVAPAKAGTKGLRFPITGGKVNAKTFAGSIRHSGGISLTKGSTVVELTRFTINVDSEPDLTAVVGNQRVSILKLDLSALEAKVQGRRVTLSGVRATLTAAAAGALNQAFSTNAFAEGLLLGTATVSARAS